MIFGETGIIHNVVAPSVEKTEDLVAQTPADGRPTDEIM
jgi:hypothetical protein